jgi:hypothetical protein
MLAQSMGDNTTAVLNFVPRLDRAWLAGNYRELMRSLYAPENYYHRIRQFLAEWQPQGPSMKLAFPDLRAFALSLWELGLRRRGRRAFWRLFFATLLTRPRKFPAAMELAILGHHFRIVADKL